MRGAQQAAIDRQGQVSSAVNDALAGGIEGVAGVADALDALRTDPNAGPALTSPGDSVTNQGALRQALANLAQAQLDATNRNAHIAGAVNAGVIAGTEGVDAVAAGLRRLAEEPEAAAPSIDEQRANELAQRALQALRDVSPGDEPALTSPGDAPIHLCPTCQGTGRVTYK